MADAKIYVQVKNFDIKDIFDSKHKSRVQALMTKTAEQAVKGSSKLTVDEPKEKGAKGWTLDSSLVSLGPDKAGKKFGANVSMSISTWPGKSMKSFPTGYGGFAIGSADEKISPGDVDQVAVTAVKEAMKTAIKYLESTKV
ncbi:MAG: hypothetical protein ABI460_13430 [Caldimonas sp.]